MQNFERSIYPSKTCLIQYATIVLREDISQILLNWETVSEHLYIVVMHRRSPKTQVFANEWGSQGRLLSIHTNELVMEAAEAAQKQGSRVFIYEASCPKNLKSHISQEVKIASVNRGEGVVIFEDHKLVFFKPPFKATMGTYRKWSPIEPLERF